MPDFLLELFSEEIPARMQEAAAKDMERLVVGALSDRGLMFDGIKSFSGPRRLTLAISGLPAKQPDVSEERKGPRVGAPEKALEGFLRSAGVTLDQCAKQSDAKGEFYVAVIARQGRATAEVLAEIVPEAMAKLPWPKSMRWTAGAIRWVRPLHFIVATFDGEVVPFEFANVKSGNATRGHRFLSNGAIEVRRFEDYEKKLRDAHVILDPAERKEIILHEVQQKAFALGLELVADDGLLDEVSGLAEWPVVLIGKIEDEYMDLPPEILRTSMRTHQKYFALKTPGKEGLANRFAVVANMAARDGGKEIVAGNERVLRARLSDAKFFWDQDRKKSLQNRAYDLQEVVFHAKLGTQQDRVLRLQVLSRMIAREIGADEKLSGQAAKLCKADLTTGVVGEFPELQGVMGYYYAIHEGEDLDVARAIRDHYLPIGPSSPVPTALVSAAVSLADKIDTLACFFEIDEIPTGSSDPYALRRAAHGIIRIILDNQFRLNVEKFTSISVLILSANRHSESKQQMRNRLENLDIEIGLSLDVDQTIADFVSKSMPAEASKLVKNIGHVTTSLRRFLAERVKVVLREKGTRHDLVDAVFSLSNDSDLVRLVARVAALQIFLKSDDGANLLVAYRRTANILKAEEKKDKTTFDGAPNVQLLKEPQEIALAKALAEAEPLIATELKSEHFVEAMGQMAKLRAPVDAFFDKVTVNAPEPELRRNRLLLLSRLRATLHLVADFSKIEG